MSVSTSSSEESLLSPGGSISFLVPKTLKPADFVGTGSKSSVRAVSYNSEGGTPTSDPCFPGLCNLVLGKTITIYWPLSDTMSSIL